MKKLVFPLVPYITVSLGIFVFRSAWLAIIAYHLAMLLVVLTDKNRPSPGQLFRTNGALAPVSLAGLGACVGIALYLLWPYLSVPGDLGAYLQSLGLNGLSWLLFIAYYAGVNPLVEEYYWRAYPGTGSKLPEPNDFFFAGYHIVLLAGKMGVLWLAVLFLLLVAVAWLWRQSGRFSGGYLAGTLSHLAADLTIIVAVYLMAGR